MILVFRLYGGVCISPQVDFAASCCGLGGGFGGLHACGLLVFV